MRLAQIAGAALAAVVLCSSVSAQDAEAVLLNDTAGGTLELQGERRLDVSGFAGTLSFRNGKDGELRYAARTLDDKRAELAVDLWVDEGTLLLRPAHGVFEPKALIEVTVPEALALKIEGQGSRITVNGIFGDLALLGTDVEFTGRGLHGDVELELIGGTARVEGTESQLTIDADGGDVNVNNARGPVLATLKDSRLVILIAESDVEIDARSSEVSATGLDGELRLNSEKGRVELRASTGGGLLELEDTPLLLNQTKGDLEILTDMGIEFEGHSGGLKISGFGAPLKGEGLEGSLELETDNAEVVLRGITGEHSIRGSGLKINISDTRGDLRVVGSSSDVVIEGCNSTLFIENEYGDIKVHKATQQTEVISREGGVRITGFRGSIQLEADGPEVEVSWAALNLPEESFVENIGGDVRVSLPPNTNIQVEAEAPHGRVESDLEDIEITDDGHYASGMLFNARNAPHVKKPSIALRSAGDLYLFAGQPE